MIYLLLLALFVQPLPADAQAVNEKQLLNKGLKLEQSGEYEQALDLWETALTKLNQPSFAIGRQYVRLAAKQGLQQRYKTASAMYRWGISAKKVASNRKALKEEIAMLEPLAGSNTANRWQKLLNENNPRLFEQLRLFWKKQDPTPASSYNERLIEHWERIAYARKHFARNAESVYGTDDRGLSWVKYGAPDRHFEDNLRLSPTRVSTAINILDPKLDKVQKEALKNAALQLHNSSRYEVWVYDRMNENMEHNLVLIFGSKPSGGFQRVQTIGELIPNRAFSFSPRYQDSQIMNRTEGRKNPNLTPGMILQYMYYEQLATKDPYFASIFNRISTQWEGDTRYGQNQALNISAGPMSMLQAKTATLQNEAKAPSQISTYEQRLPNIPIKTRQYRLLNENNRPVFITFMESNPQQVFVNDLAVNQDSMFTGKLVTANEAFQYYKLYHGLQIRNEAGKILSRSRMPATLVVDSTNAEESSSVFKVPQLPEEARILLYAELHNTHPATEPRMETPFPSSLRGQGKVQLEQREPLEVNTTKLQMGDLILGYQMQRSTGGGLFPFVVANDQKIPAYENLAVHVEVYHLKLGSDGTGRFQLSYKILPRTQSGWTKEREQEFSLTLNMETRKPHFSENLEIKASELKPGRYTLRMTASERESGRKISREINFEVVER